MNDNRCTVPFDSISVFDADSGLSTPCCKILRTPVHPVRGLLNDVTMSVRQSILNNERSEYCSACWKIIDEGGISRRTQNSNHDTIDWSNIKVDQPVEHLQINFSKVCQLQCVYCGPWSSTTWSNNIEKYNGYRYPITDVDKNLKVSDYVDIESLKSIQISGGEPLLSDECIDFLLNDLDFNPDRKLSLITNLSYGPAVFNKLLEIIKKHPTISVRVSLDAIGDNTSRKYLNWDLWKRNFDSLIDNLQERIKLHSNTFIYIKPTANILNYHKIPELVNFIVDLKRKGIKNLTFSIGTPFMHEMSSLWSDEIDNTVRINLEEEDLALLTESEILHIQLFNDTIKNAKVIDTELQDSTKKYIKIYLADE